ncbi:MAG: PQQ-like beta-propeller repeat protein [Candidatus Heimdallarchaeota archaeon]|nr:PQQ-like beta-propeller repeat protein [Candidatus Heimdallarchaeota archaeon]
MNVQRILCLVKVIFKVLLQMLVFAAMITVPFILLYTPEVCWVDDYRDMGLLSPVKVDGQENIVFINHYFLTDDPNYGESGVESIEGEEVFVLVKLDTDGNLLFMESIKGYNDNPYDPDHLPDLKFDLVIDNYDNIYIIRSIFKGDFLLQKFNSVGQKQWEKIIDVTGFDIKVFTIGDDILVGYTTTSELTDLNSYSYEFIRFNAAGMELDPVSLPHHVDTAQITGGISYRLEDISTTADTLYHIIIISYYESNLLQFEYIINSYDSDYIFQDQLTINREEYGKMSFKPFDNVLYGVETFDRNSSVYAFDPVSGTSTYLDSINTPFILDFDVVKLSDRILFNIILDAALGTVMYEFTGGSIIESSQLYDYNTHDHPYNYEETHIASSGGVILLYGRFANNSLITDGSYQSSYAGSSDTLLVVMDNDLNILMDSYFGTIGAPYYMCD